MTTTEGARSRRGRLALLLVALAPALATFPVRAATSSTSVGAISVTPSSLTGSAHGQSWTIRFTTSSSGALSANKDHIVLSAPPGTFLPTSMCAYRIGDLSTTDPVEQCPGVTLSSDATMVTLALHQVNVAAGDQVVLTIDGVTNPPAGTLLTTTTVSTSADQVAAHPAAAPTMGLGGSVSGVNVRPGTLAGQATGVRWTVGFTTSPSGTLTPPSFGLDTGSITIAAPSGTMFAPSTGSPCPYTVIDVNLGTAPFSCANAVVTNGGSTVRVSMPQRVRGGDQVLVGINDVTNPAAGASLSATRVWTDSDPQPVAPSSTDQFTLPQPVSEPQLNTSTPAGPATAPNPFDANTGLSGWATWSITFRASASGTLAAGFGTITLVLPSGTVFQPGPPTTYCLYRVVDLSAGADGGFSPNSCAKVTLSVGRAVIISPVDVTPGDTVIVVINEIINPPSGTALAGLTIATSSDVMPAHPGTHTVVQGAKQVTGIAVGVSSLSGGAQQTTWTVAFTTSANGGLSRNGGLIFVTAPFLSNRQSGVGAQVFDLTTGAQASSGGASAASAGSATLSVGTPIQIGPGDTVLVVITGVTNPPPGAPWALTVATTSDTVPASAPNGPVLGPPTSIHDLVVTPSTLAGGATQTTWSVKFTTSRYGGLRPQGSISLQAPAGTGFPTGLTLGCFYTITDLNTSASESLCSQPGSTQSVETIDLNNLTINPGDTMLLVVTHVANPPAGTALESTAVWTSSDPAPVHAAPARFVAATSMSAVVGSLSKDPLNNGSDLRIRFTASAHGGLQPSGGTPGTTGPPYVMITTTSGSLYPHYWYGDLITDLTTGESTRVDTGQPCGPGANMNPTQCLLTVGLQIHAGDTVLLEIKGISSLPTTTPLTDLTVWTTSDTVPVHPSPLPAYNPPGPGPSAVSGFSIMPSTRSGTARATSWSIAFTVISASGLDSSNGAAIYFIAPAGTVFPASATPPPTNCPYTLWATSTGQTACAAAIVAPGGNIVRFTPASRFTANGGEQVWVTINGVTNPPPASYPAGAFDLWTNSDQAFAHPASGLQFAGPPANVALGLTVNTSTSAGGATRARWTLEFTASPFGALDPHTAAVIAIAVPPGTRLPASGQCAYAMVDLASGEMGCGTATVWPTGNVAVLNLPQGFWVQAGDRVWISVEGVTNGPAGQYPSSLIAVATSSDWSLAHPSNGLTLTPPQQPSGTTIHRSTTTGGAARTVWSLGFSTSPTGALEGKAGATITLVAPSGTVWPTTSPSGLGPYIVWDTTAGTVTNPTVAITGSTVTLALPSSTVIRAGDAVTVLVEGATNPSVGTYAHGAISVQTSSDTVPAGPSLASTFSPPQAPAQVRAMPSLFTGGAVGSWSFAITTSATGTLFSGSLGAVDIAVTGATFPSSPASPCSPFTVWDTTTGDFSSGCAKAIPGGVEVLVPPVDTAMGNGPIEVLAGDALWITLPGLTNPPAGPLPPTSMTVSTSSDTTAAHPATSANFAAPSIVSQLSVTPSTSAGGAAYSTWTVCFTTSPHGQLGSGGSVTFAAPSGTILPTYGPTEVFFDLTTGQVFGALGFQQATTTGFTVSIGNSVNSGDRLCFQVLAGNPPPGTYAASTFSVSTSSDPATAHPALPVTFSPPGAAAAVTVTPNSTVGAQTGTTWAVGFDPSFTGALIPANGTAGFLTLTFPTGSVIGVASYVLWNLSTGESISGRSYGGSPNIINFQAALDARPGDHLRVVVGGVANPPRGSYPASSFTLVTTSDPASAHPAQGFLFS